MKAIALHHRKLWWRIAIVAKGGLKSVNCCFKA